MVWGEQWDCGCGTSNLFLRTRCRDCRLPRELAVGAKGVGAVMEAVAVQAAAEAGRDRPARGGDQRR